MSDVKQATPGFVPDWNLPSGVKAWQTYRGNGPLPYGGFNLGQHVGDDRTSVDANRRRLMKAVVPAEPVWLSQVHGTRVLDLSQESILVQSEADASMTTTPGVVCAVLTADCLPVLLADRFGRVVGAAHAGWRGLAAGVLEALVHQMNYKISGKPSELIAWLGPAIGPDAFEVGDDVLQAFMAQNPSNKEHFQPNDSGKWFANLPALAETKLRQIGLTDVTHSGFCSYTQSDRFYSYRKDQVTGRMATMIWIDP